MNPAAFSAQGGAVPGMDKQNQVQGAQVQQQLLKHVLNTLKSKGTVFTGWQQSVAVQDRAMKVCQLASNLRLVEPNRDLKSVVTAAINIEENIFRQAPNQPAYESGWREKCIQFRNLRQQRAAQYENGMASQASPMGSLTAGTQGQMQPGLQNQWSQPIQTPQMTVTPQQPHQQHSAMGMNFPNPQMQSHPQGFAPNGQQQRQMPSWGDVELTRLEIEQANHLGDQMMQRATAAELEKANLALQRLPPERKQQIAQKGMTELQWLFRSQALNNIKRAKLNMMKSRGQAGLQGDTKGMQQRQMGQAMMGQQGNLKMPIGQQGVDPNFAGSVDHIQGQQVDGMLSQEAGHLVVPATSAPVVGQHQFVGQQGQQNINRAGVNPALVAQQQRQQQQQNLQNAQQAQFQAQNPAQAQARAHAAAQAQIAMSSQQTPQMSHAMPQQSPAMSMINRPIPPSQVPPAQTTPQPAAATPRPQIPPHFPLQVQNRLATLPPDQMAMMIQNIQQRTLANNQALQRPGQPGLPMQQSPAHEPSQIAQPTNTHPLMDPNARAAMPIQQNMAGLSGMPPHTQGLHLQQPTMHQPKPQPQPQPQTQQQQQQNAMLRQQLLRQQIGALDMTEDQVRNMDKAPFPPGMVNNTSLATNLPKNVVTWGQLKLWASQNPQLTGDISLHHLELLQKRHFNQYVAAQREAASRNAAQNAGMGQNFVPPHLFSQQARQPGQLPQHPQLQQPAGQKSHFLNMAAFFPVTAADILKVRQKLGKQAQNLSDDVIKDMIEKNRRKEIQARMAGQQFPSQPLNQGQQAAFQASQSSTLQPSQQPIHASPSQQLPINLDNKSLFANAPQPPQPKQSGRGLKRPSEDEGGFNMANVPQHGVAPIQPGAQQPRVQITREQWAAMTPQQRVMWHNNLRQQQSQQQQPQQQQQQQQGQARRPPSKAVAEEAWNRLPDNIRARYAAIVQKDSQALPVALTSTEKGEMAKLLRESVEILGRMDTLVAWMLKTGIPDEHLHTILNIRMYLIKQFKDPDWTPADQFTISKDFLAKITTIARNFFHRMIHQITKQNPAVRPGPSQSPPVELARMQPLNATNLQQHNQQQAALHRERRANAQAVPPAPTAAQPPFPLGVTSPQGVPHAYGPQSMNPDNLTLPPAKKHKRNPPQKDMAKQSPAQQPQDQKATPSDAGKPAATPKAAEGFKCAEPECKAHIKGFASQEELDKHVEECHKADEPIENALEFALESFKVGLGLDKEKPTAAETEKKQPASSEKPSLSVKPGATPSNSQMARTTSSAGVKSTSPALSNLAKTPQTAALKPSGPSQVKPATGEEAKKDEAKSSEPSSGASKDAWADTQVSLDDIQMAFKGITDDAFLEYGNGIRELLADAFTDMQANDTPHSTDTGANTQTPQDSDVSKDEDARMVAETPPDWVNLTSDIADHLVMTDRFVDVDWDSMLVEDAPLSFGGDNDKVYSI